MKPYLIAFSLFLISLLFAVISLSLRNFQRSRLSAYCRSRNNIQRFRNILQHDESALQACALVQILFFVSTIFVCVHTLLPKPSLILVVLDILGVGIASWLLLLLLPWSLSRVAAEQILYNLWPMIRLITWLLNPFLLLTRRFDVLMHRVAGLEDPLPDSVDNFIDEIQSVVDEGEREGVIESRAGRMIQRVMELQDEDVRAVMTPRTDIVSLQLESTLEQACQFVLEEGRSRIPVVDGSTDDIVGLVYTMDLLSALSSETRPSTLAEILRPPNFVPETIAIVALLEQMQQSQFHIAIVLDEYGGVSGLVTMEDMIELIVGDIADEFDEKEEVLFSVLDEKRLKVDARMHLDDLNELFNLELPDEDDFETVGGFLLSELGHIPRVGETLSWQGVEFKVTKSTERIVQELEMTSQTPWHQSASNT